MNSSEKRILRYAIYILASDFVQQKMSYKIKSQHNLCTVEKLIGDRVTCDICANTFSNNGHLKTHNLFICM